MNKKRLGYIMSIFSLGFDLTFMIFLIYIFITQKIHLVDFANFLIGIGFIIQVITLIVGLIWYYRYEELNRRLFLVLQKLQRELFIFFCIMGGVLMDYYTDNGVIRFIEFVTFIIFLRIVVFVISHLLGLLGGLEFFKLWSLETVIVDALKKKNK